MEKHRKKLIKNAAVFDGHSSGLAQGKKIVIEDDIVTEITADEVSEENFDEVFDGTGMVAMPGMTDAHVHMGCLFAKGEFPVDYATVLTVAKCKNALMAGFTTFRDAGSVSEGLKLAFDEGVLPGPRIYPCGAYISQTCGHGDSEYAHTYRDIQYRHPSSTVLADGVPEIIRAVREQFYRGASHIKLMAGGGCMSSCDPIETVQFTAEEMKAACDVAADYGTYVMAHLYTPKAILRALGAGVRSLEHAHLIDETAAEQVAAAGAFLNPMPQFKKYEDMLKQVSEESQKITAAGENFIKKEQQAYSARKQQMSEKECNGADEIEKYCPKCGSKLVLRKATKGSNAGRNFYGCSAFPKCRYIENI